MMSETLSSVDASEVLKLENQLCFRLYAASRAITKLYQPHLERLDLTYPQYLVMLVLWQDGGDVNVNQLGALLHLDSGTLSPLLKRLETKQLIIRRRDPSDERRVVICLSHRGLVLKEQAAEIPVSLYQQHQQNSSPLDIDLLKRELDNLMVTLAGP